MDKTKDKEATNVNGQAQINDEEPLDCPIQHGYKPSICRYLILYPLATIPCGIGLLLAYWFPYMWIKLTCTRVSLSSATYVIVKDSNGQWRVEKVLVRTDNEDSGVAINDNEDDGDYTEEAGLMATRSSSFRVILHQHLRYLFDEAVEKFVLLRGYERDVSCVSLHNMANGLSFSEHNSRRLRYGSNDIDVPVKPYHVLFIEEVLHPFYIFQLFSCLVWLADEYYVYSVAVWIISTVSVVVSLVQTRRHMQHLHDMVKTKTDVSVIRNGTILSGISSEDLVPGDVLVVPRDGMTMPCDSVLLTGNAIVNEAMLTGESVPITKTPLPSEDIEYSSVAHRRHTLFAGTEVIQSRYYNNALVLAVVVRTGFLTSKGGMVRSILFPKPLNMKFYWDSIKFILILSVLAAVAFVYTILVLQIRTHPYQIKETILRAFDIITTVVPPSLPAAITVGTVYALNRLKKHQIYCISPQRVILCGKVKLVCFDKTGTLTEDSLDVLGVQPATSRGFSTLVSDPSELSPGPLLWGMSTCHSLTRINGKLSGDPLDMKMFLSTKWELEEPGSDDVRYDTLQMPLVHPPKEGVSPSDNGRCTSPWEHQKGLEDEGEDEEEDWEGADSLQLGILKQFTFSSELQRMSVLVRKLPSRKSNLIHVFVKGAPEMIKRLSKPESIPDDFHTVLGSLTQRGYRVLAMGYREIHKTWHHAERLKRDEIECDLTFCGLLILENKLKTQTIPVIHELQQANIRTVMITGDNLLTAVAVAGNCGMANIHERIIVIKANKPSANNRGLLPTLTYHVLGSEGVNQSLLCASTSSVIVENHQHEPSASDPFVTSGVINGKSTYAIDIETHECFHLAVDGATFSVIKEHYPELYKRLLVCGTVFARMSPNQKATLVTSLMEIGYGVTMCGDGANDCGALKAAHAGISLSETEASVASPFTSKTPDISCVPHLIREGRDALVTSISVFKFMALYSLTEFTSAAVLYAFESNLGSPQYLYVDMILILAFAFVMGLTGPYPRLVKRRPIGTLAGVHVILSILTQTFIMVGFQLGVLFYAKSEPWFEPLHPVKESDNISCYENAVIFVYSNYVYIILAVAFSTAAPYRKPFYTNIMFVLVLLLLIPCNLYMTLVPGDIFPWFWSFMQIKQSPSLWYRIALVEIACVHFVLAYLLEGFIFPSGCMRVFLRFVRCKHKPRNRYKHLLQEAKEDPSWPPPMPTALPVYYY